MENIQENNDNIRKIVLRARHHIDRDTVLSLRGTKALKVEAMKNTDNEYDNRESWGELLIPASPRGIESVDVTTWSSLIRNVLDIIIPHLQFACLNICSDEVRAIFEASVKDICEEADIRLNTNCPQRLFKEAEETDLIKSSVYLNNKNHMIKIMTDEDGIAWYMCAVYTGEIIIMIEALLDTIYELAENYTSYRDNIKEFPNHTLVLSYINREDLLYTQTKAEVDDMVEQWDNDNQVTEISRDLLRIKCKVASLFALALEIDKNISDMQKKYNLKSLDDMLK